jgi:hypothetical protein
MRASSNQWLSWVLLVVVVGIFCWRFVWPHLAKPDSAAPIKDSSLASPLNQPGGAVVPAEAYEVYSALYQQPQEPLAFAQDSQTDIPQVNGSCLKPTTGQEREMADAFAAANTRSHHWERKFAIPASYLLLSRSDTAKVRDCIPSQGKSMADCRPYQSIRHIRYLGVPGFDHTHDRALVSVIKICGNQCGSGGIFAVEKTGNTWKRSDTTDFFRDCSWMY